MPGDVISPVDLFPWWDDLLPFKLFLPVVEVLLKQIALFLYIRPDDHLLRQKSAELSSLCGISPMQKAGKLNHIAKMKMFE